jgi:hypothetical protein
MTELLGPYGSKVSAARDTLEGGDDVSAKVRKTISGGAGRLLKKIPRP